MRARAAAMPPQPQLLELSATTSGSGAGAHGKLTCSRDARAIVRTVQPREPRRYLPPRTPRSHAAASPRVELPFEFMLNALRLTRVSSATTF